MEWTLDAYAPYKAAAETDPWVKATKPYPESVRGGSWNDPADQVSCAVRVQSDASWKQMDPANFPRASGTNTDCPMAGLPPGPPRQTPPSAEEMLKYWNSGVEHDEQ